METGNLVKDLSRNQEECQTLMSSDVRIFMPVQIYLIILFILDKRPFEIQDIQDTLDTLIIQTHSILSSIASYPIPWHLNNQFGGRGWGG